jgi:D-alanyl-D-alanine carboxypeptidase/D-alanyl-D-alanine-endopeptidase (penicillin-binding protein 4)
VKRASVPAVLVLLTAALAVPPPSEARRHHKISPPSMVWCVETLAGEAVEAHDADRAINPASVVKVATTLWALEKLGPDFRFETRFLARGEIDPVHHVLHGDLVVQGGGDPDFHVENAFLVARALNELKVDRVTGALLVDRKFWIGWENGSEGRERDEVKRATLMADRLRQALDPRRWTRVTRMTWRAFAYRRDLDTRRPPRVVIAGGVGIDGTASTDEMLVVHRSQPLAEILRRFNCFSNNDIERIAADIGPVEELAAEVAARCDAAPGSVQLETASGLGTNRLTPRIVVRLLRELRRTADALKVPIEALLPVSGCDPGTVSRFFPQLADGPEATALVGKTGTLTNTDGGVAVLAGYAATARGELVFCLAVPHASGKIKLARRTQQQWVLNLLIRNGGGRPHHCEPPLATSDKDVSVIVLGDHVVPPLRSPASAGAAAKGSPRARSSQQ